jgi:hypothetical protein
MVKSVRALAVLLGVCWPYAAVLGVEDIESVTFTATVSEHKIEATLSSKAFDSRQHKIVLPPRGSGKSARIDGKPPIGTDETADARTEFSRFEVRWDGKPVSIPSSLYADCFNLNLKRKEGWWDDKGTIYFLPSQDGSSLLIQMHGSDGAGSYFATWIISRSGKNQRFIDEEIP